MNAPGTETRSRAGSVLANAALQGLACLATFAIITRLLSHAYFVSRDDQLLGGMWAVIATIFVYHQSYQQTLTAALSRLASTSLSFVLCFAYLLLFPFRAWGMAALIALGTLLMALLGRSQDIAATAITTAVIMVAAALSPEHAWKVPILRLFDTIVGIAVGLAAGRLALTFAPPPHRTPGPPSFL
jgi:uncharacterized membrane protein YgaE (UPF0421/DUF939 family)